MSKKLFLQYGIRLISPIRVLTRASTWISQALHKQHPIEEKGEAQTEELPVFSSTTET